MTMILGGLDMTRYRTQLGIGKAKDAHSRRAAVDAGLFFDFDDDGGGRRAGQGRAFKRVALESLQGSAKALDLASRRNPRWGD